VEEVKIHYLNWDEEAEEHGPASDLFHKYTVESVLEEDEKPPTEFSEDEFQELYREIATVEGEYSNPEQLWKEWNNGSRQESQEFYDAEVRSMSVGDVVEIGDTYYQAKEVGFEEIEVNGGGE
jgi:hypothetical protein